MAVRYIHTDIVIYIHIHSHIYIHINMLAFMPKIAFALLSHTLEYGEYCTNERKQL